MPGDYMIYVWILLAGSLVTYVWRVIAVMAVSRIDPNSELLVWVRNVATALVAALCMKLVFFPSGLLAESLLATRCLSMATAIASFYVFNRKPEIAVSLAIFVFFLSEALFH